ncbi:glutathione S-transferase N-terminal domain-containing protein [Azotobacter vinelandii]
MARFIKKLNPQCLVPTLELNGLVLNESLAIIEYLDERFPDPPLLPKKTWRIKLKIRALSQLFAYDTHPLLTRRVNKFFYTEIQLTEKKIRLWQHYWLKKGFDAAEEILLQNIIGDYCFGNSPSLADVCLVPQCDSALRLGFDLKPYSRIIDIYDHCKSKPAFTKSLILDKANAV